jgi:putative flavoprotein involved in K+ transport
MHRFLDAVDAYAERSGLVPEIWPPERPPPVSLPLERPTSIDLRAELISTIVVASGYRPSYPWLRLPILGEDGDIEQDRGVTRAPGVFTVGQTLQLQRSSGTIAGAAADATYVVDLIGRTQESSITTGRAT